MTKLIQDKIERYGQMINKEGEVKGANKLEKVCSEENKTNVLRKFSFKCLLASRLPSSKGKTKG